jgi:hypothetical protein
VSLSHLMTCLGFQARSTGKYTYTLFFFKHHQHHVDRGFQGYRSDD